MALEKLQSVPPATSDGLLVLRNVLGNGRLGALSHVGLKRVINGSVWSKPICINSGKNFEQASVNTEGHQHVIASFVYLSHAATANSVRHGISRPWP